MLRSTLTSLYGGHIILIAAAVIPAFFLLRFIYRHDKLESESFAMIRNLVLMGIVSTFIAVMCERLGSSKIFNVAVIGIAAGCGALPASAQTVRERIIKTVPARFAEMNMKAFEEGLKIGEEYADK